MAGRTGLFSMSYVILVLVHTRYFAAVFQRNNGFKTEAAGPRFWRTQISRVGKHWCAQSALRPMLCALQRIKHVSRRGGHTFELRIMCALREQLGGGVGHCCLLVRELTIYPGNGTVFIATWTSASIPKFGNALS